LYAALLDMVGFHDVLLESAHVVMESVEPNSNRMSFFFLKLTAPSHFFSNAFDTLGRDDWNLKKTLLLWKIDLTSLYCNQIALSPHSSSSPSTFTGFLAYHHHFLI